MAVRRAPATLCPISSPLSPSLTSLFWIRRSPSCSPFFLSFASSYLCYIPTLSTKRHLGFFSSFRAFPPGRADISISASVDFSNFHTLPHFSAITFHDTALPCILSLSDFAVANDYTEFHPRPVVQPRLSVYYPEPRSENNGLLSKSLLQNLHPCTSRRRAVRF